MVAILFSYFNYLHLRSAFVRRRRKEEETMKGREVYFLTGYCDLALPESWWEFVLFPLYVLPILGWMFLTYRLRFGRPKHG